MSEPTPPRRRRRWFSLSLRGMMILILVVGGLMGWKARRASLQRQAVARVKTLGGVIRYDWNPDPDLLTTAVNPEPPGPEWLRRILGDEYFQEVAGVTLLVNWPNPPAPLPLDLTDDDSPELRAMVEGIRKDRAAIHLKKETAVRRVIDDDLACLEGLDRIETLHLEGISPKAAGQARLGRLTRLKDFTTHTPIDAETLGQLARLSRIEKLDIQLKLTDDSALASLEHLPMLKSLTIFDGTLLGRINPTRLTADQATVPSKITDAWLTHLGRLKHLNFLSLDGSEITDAGLANLQELSELEYLFLDYTDQITDLGVSHLSNLKSLKSISLMSSTGITDKGLAHLASLEKLIHLSLQSASGVTDAGLFHLSSPRRLEVIVLESASGVTDAGMAYLASLPELKALDLNVRLLTPAGMDRFQSMKKLKWLRLTGAKIKGEVLDGIEAAIPGLTLTAERIDDGPTSEPGTSPSAPSSPPVPNGGSPVDPVTPPPVVPRN